MDLAFNIKLVAFDLKDSAFSVAIDRRFRQDEALLSHVLLDFLKSDVRESNLVSLTELGQALRLSRQTRLDFKHVEKGLSSDLAGVRAEENVFACLLLHLISKRNRIFERKVLKESLRKLGETV